VHRFVSINGRDDELLYVWVPRIKDPVVCLSDGRAYQRKGSNTVELSTAEILELRYARGEKSFEDRPVVRYQEQLLDPAVTKAFMDGVVQRNGVSMPLTTDNTNSR
jgi:predicted HTH transcriptional regulator